MRFCAAGDVGRQMAAAVMDVSDTKEWLHLAAASEWGGLEVMNRKVESKREGGKTATRLQISAFAFDISGLQLPACRGTGKKREFEKQEAAEGMILNDFFTEQRACYQAQMDLVLLQQPPLQHQS